MVAGAPPKHVAIVGGGPAGLMAAEVAARGGAAVTVYERMPTVGRKFLLAGRGGLNLTHSEELAAFLGATEPPSRAFAPRSRPFRRMLCARGAKRWARKRSWDRAGGCFPSR